ncbi:MAG: methylmalonyl Co-A mutase-associated GTPase MeaB [Candidatus Cloacimonadota bacterium]|nr:MAG: methylmalonyl Co-A mutase-associated GTPase MeaB [Candidatus Cloacimonadota bacterium]
MTETHKPKWTPENAGNEFACRVMKGVDGGHDGMDEKKIETKKFRKRKHLSIDELAEGILKRDKVILAQAITLIESNAFKHQEKAQELLKKIMPYAGKSIRIGITGVPGAGKSTFIEAFGNLLIDLGHKVAVLAVDPSSSVTKGSILGDKTRMETLARNDNCFIRPSPSSGTLGGVHRKTRESMLACEASGFDVILVETVGVGQSEVTVRSMVDFFLLLKISGAGDELQGIKKGVIELADSILINKADGANKIYAETAREEFDRALHYLKPATCGWTPHAYTCSALHKTGLKEIWEVIKKFIAMTKENKTFELRRREQVMEWVDSMVKDYLYSGFYNNPEIIKHFPLIKKHVEDGIVPPTKAVRTLIDIYNRKQ